MPETTVLVNKSAREVYVSQHTRDMMIAKEGLGGTGIPKDFRIIVLSDEELRARAATVPFVQPPLPMPQTAISPPVARSVPFQAKGALSREATRRRRQMEARAAKAEATNG